MGLLHEDKIVFVQQPFPVPLPPLRGPPSPSNGEGFGYGIYQSPPLAAGEVARASVTVGAPVAYAHLCR